MSAPAFRPGQGRTTLKDHVQQRLGILRGLSRFLERQTDATGALVCRRHRVEHTGKNVYGALINHALWRFTREEEYADQARAQALRAVDHLGLDPGSQVPVFLPGRVDPRNASTNSIDGGACADVLATLLEETPDLFDDDQRARVTAAVETHVEGYLRHSARDRSITAQRLWAGTGVARAARLLGRDDWREDALAGCRLALDELHADGVAPYIPAGSSDCSHPGLAETSTFYHSRTPAFVLYIHGVLEEAFSDEQRAALRRSLDVLVAMRDGNGLKVLHNEAKPWYWESAYEVASHPFDAFALHVGGKLLEDEVFAGEAGRVMEEWAAHLSALDGGVLSHHGRGTNFQCRIFWSGHAAWVARIMEDVPLRALPRPHRDVDAAASGLLHVERTRYTLVARGRRQPSGTLFGCDAGGGTVQSLVVHPDPRVPRGYELVPRRRFRMVREGSVRVRPAAGPGRIARWLELLRREKGDLRFRVYIATVEWGAGRWFGAVAYVLRHVLLRPWREATPWACAHLDQETRQDYDGRRVVFEGGVADVAGRRLAGVATRRTLECEDERLVLVDEVTLVDVRARVRYLLPVALVDAQVSAEGAAVRRRGREVALEARGGEVRLVVRGHWPTDVKAPVWTP